MARLTIKLTREAGGSHIRVGFQSDVDSLPLEHEDDHRRLVAKLLSSLAGVTRERPAREAAVG